ncbi:MAG: hypothetical protein NT077_01845 [Candidatus Taylorbacteria bacterium]|nr:hypothetical protein [Candidatus Taylorbacteria bacterium]
MYSRTKKSGFTLVETLTYGVGLVIVLGGIVTFTVYLYDWYRTSTIPTRVDQVGIALINRVSNDIRGANSVNDSSSIFNNQNGVLSLTTTSGTISTTTVYALQNGVMQYKLNSTATSSISSDDISISGFYVKKLTTPVSTVVRVEIDIDYVTKAGTNTSIYNGLAVLRQSYQ